MIEERSSGAMVVNQPGGHINAGESPEQATEREALEETRCQISVTGLLGVYLWIHPQTRRNFLRIVYVADLIASDPKRSLDHGIYAVHWYTLADVKQRIKDLRTPVVLRTIEDYIAGQRKPATLLANMLPIQQNVGQVMANAILV